MPRTGYEGRFTGYDGPWVYTTPKARQSRYWTPEEKQRIQGIRQPVREAGYETESRNQERQERSAPNALEATGTKRSQRSKGKQ